MTRSATNRRYSGPDQEVRRSEFEDPKSTNDDEESHITSATASDSDPDIIPCRIAHLVSLKNLGGVERYFSRFFDCSARRDDSHVLLQTNGIHPYLDHYFRGLENRLHGIKGPKGLKLPTLGNLRSTYQQRLLRELAPEALLVWNKISRHPLTLPRDIPIYHFERGSAWLAKDDPSLRRYIERLSGVLGISRAAHRILQLKWGLDPELPSKTLNNAIDLPALASEHPEGRFRLGFAGRLQGLKAPMIALETLRALKPRFPAAELWIAGQGPLEPVLREWTHRWQLEESVTFCGPVADMSGFYSQLDAFVCPSWREPFGNVVQEAVAHGLPTVVGNIDGLPESILDPRNGAILEPTRPREVLRKYGDACLLGPREVYSPDQDDLVQAKVLDPEAIAETLLAWAENPRLRRQIATRAREQVARDYTLERYVESLAEFFNAQLR
ncbi:glycosyltransferase family 4 protein [Salinicola halophyticus]|uniref:glycosyltransferase family 4 protein n=1 Tax=Salinicola halophyticus TaxID=1808881 RepID=UPI000DA18BEF|nr:glycosyltransferase family 4 protein [Salinicola halophyticus]